MGKQLLPAALSAVLHVPREVRGLNILRYLSIIYLFYFFFLSSGLWLCFFNLGLWKENKCVCLP